MAKKRKRNNRKKQNRRRNARKKTASTPKVESVKKDYNILKWGLGIAAAGIIALSSFYFSKPKGTPIKVSMPNIHQVEERRGTIGEVVRKEVPKPIEVIPKESQVPLESIIQNHGTIHGTKNLIGKGNFYLIGMKHNYILKDREGKKNLVVSTSSDIPKIQTDIYLILKGMKEHKKAKVLFGEGLKPGEFMFEGQETRYDAKHPLTRQQLEEFFKKRQKEVAYTTLEYNHPEWFNMFGVNDTKELKESFEKDRQAYEARRSERTMREINQPQLVNHYRFMQRHYNMVKDMTVFKRSQIYLKESQSFADKHKIANFIFITGDTHAEQMFQMYKGKRKLTYIRPIHMTK